jgi:hypothetical protein
MALTAHIAQHWLKLLPSVRSFVQRHMYDSGVCYRCLFLRFHWGFYSLFLTWYEHSVELESRSMVSFTVMCVECQGTFQNEVAADQDVFNQWCIPYCYESKLLSVSWVGLSWMFLDLSRTRKATRLSINIYQKPTTTDNTIHFLSNKNWQPTISLSVEWSPSHLTPNSNKKNGNTYYTLPKATVPPGTYCSV